MARGNCACTYSSSSTYGRPGRSLHQHSVGDRSDGEDPSSVHRGDGRTSAARGVVLEVWTRQNGAAIGTFWWVQGKYQRYTITSSCKTGRKGRFAGTRQNVITTSPSQSPVSYMKQWKALLNCGQLLPAVMAT